MQLPMLSMQSKLLPGSVHTVSAIWNVLPHSVYVIH